MDRASSLIFPGSKTLAGWWRQLAPHQPLALWVGYAYVHRIEATVQVLAARPLEPLAGLVLQAIDVEQSAGAKVGAAELAERLRLPEPILQHVARGLTEAGLLSAGDGWCATDMGRHAFASRQVPHRSWERRVFPFIERLDGTGQRAGAPCFAPLADCVGVPWQVEPAYRFDPAALETCITEVADWKVGHCFPLDAEALAKDAGLAPWQHVLVDRSERVMLVFVLSKEERLLGFAVKVETWTLHDQAPALRLPGAARRLWPDLAHDTPLALWQDAWRAWCRQRQLPANEVDACTVTHQPPRLEVQAPPRLVQRLQAAKSDLFKGDAWLLVGDGFFRPAAQLVVRQS